MQAVKLDVHIFGGKSPLSRGCAAAPAPATSDESLAVSSWSPDRLLRLTESPDNIRHYLIDGVLAARGKGRAAFERPHVPADCVARHSNRPDILVPRALPAGPFVALCATKGFCHELPGARTYDRRPLVTGCLA